MDTTQTESVDMPAPSERADRPVHSRPWLAGVGALFSLATFLFGGFLALLVLPFILPPLRRWRMFGYGLFAGVVVVRVLMAMGVNPVLDYAQSQVIARLEAALGAEVSFDDARGDVINGRLQFEGMRADISELRGGIAIQQVTVDAGWFMLYRPGGLRVSGRGLEVRVDADEGRLEEWLKERDSGAGEPVEFEIEEGAVEVTGGTHARFMLDGVTGNASSQGWVVHLGMREAAVTFRERTHTLAIMGGISVGDQGEGFMIDVDLRATEPELGGGIMRGRLHPGSDSQILCTVDELYLKPLWARYRKVDEYDGYCDGTVRIGGELNELHFDIALNIRDYTYFHGTAMGLDREHAFDLPLGDITGRVTLLGGEDVVFKDVTLITEDATLATGKRMNARGAGMVILNGPVSGLTGRLEAVVESGEINHQITWSRERPESLSDITPNLVIVGEQFASLELSWEVAIKELDVNTPPLSGTLTGGLAGTLIKEEGVRVAKVRAEGELSMEGGKVDCLGLQGEFQGKLTFNPSAPMRHAALRGQIDGALGDTPIDCEVTGELVKPGFIFKGMSMSPEALGRKLYRYSPETLTEAELLERRNECSRVFGAYAATRENPFEARSTGKVFFGFR